MRVRMQLIAVLAVAWSLISGIRSDFQFTILHTNDVHARFEEFSKFGSPCSSDDCYGGVARRIHKIREIRSQEENVILLDAGDQYQGTLWFYVHKGQAARHFMNKAQYDAMALGNHEFDNHVSGVLPFMRNVSFPVLSANIDAHLEPEVEPLLAPSTVLEVGGERIGVIGYTTKYTPMLSYPGSLKFRDEVDALRDEVEKLKNSGINKIIALGHAGLKVDSDIASRVEGVDVVIGGHTNTFMYTGDHPSIEKPTSGYPKVVVQEWSGDTVLVVQDYAFGKYLGYLKVTFKDDGKVKDWSGNPILLDRSVPKDPETEAEVQEWLQPISESFNKIIGRTHVFLDGTRRSCRLKECNLGNLLTDAMVIRHLREPDEMYWSNVTMAVVNGGSIRASINQGDISMGDLLSVQPFTNTMDLVELKGRYIKEMFEHAVTRWDPIEQEGKFLQVSGIRVTFDLTRPEGSRVVDLQVLCSRCRVPHYVPLEADTSYQFIAPAFLVSGGDGYTMIKKHMTKHHIFGDVDIDVAVEYIAATSPIIAPLDGRIKFVDSAEQCSSSSQTNFKPNLSAIVLLCFFVFTLLNSVDIWGNCESITR